MRQSTSRYAAGTQDRHLPLAALLRRSFFAARRDGHVSTPVFGLLFLCEVRAVFLSPLLLLLFVLLLLLCRLRISLEGGPRGLLGRSSLLDGANILLDSAFKPARTKLLVHTPPGGGWAPRLDRRRTVMVLLVRNHRRLGTGYVSSLAAKIQNKLFLFF